MFQVHSPCFVSTLHVLSPDYMIGLLTTCFVSSLHVLSLLYMFCPHVTGKIKYTLPVYKALVKGTDKTRELATQIFNRTRDQLHMEVRQRVEKILTQQN